MSLLNPSLGTNYMAWADKTSHETMQEGLEERILPRQGTDSNYSTALFQFISQGVLLKHIFEHKGKVKSE